MDLCKVFTWFLLGCDFFLVVLEMKPRALSRLASTPSLWFVTFTKEALCRGVQKTQQTRAPGQHLVPRWQTAFQKHCFDSEALLQPGTFQLPKECLGISGLEAAEMRLSLT